ncbi:hypothetical protein D9M69_694360 [compost metagenome]
MRLRAPEGLCRRDGAGPVHHQRFQVWVVFQDGHRLASLGPAHVDHPVEGAPVETGGEGVTGERLHPVHRFGKQRVKGRVRVHVVVKVGAMRQPEWR